MKQSKQLLYSLALIILLLLAVTPVNYSQTYVDVAPGFGTLNTAVTSNTSADVIFRLQRGDGAIYLLNGAITATTPLRIEAAAGTGARPKLIPGIGSGGVSDIPIRVKANVTLKGLFITAKDEAGAYLTQIIRVQADGIRLIVDDCFLENSAQSAIRTDNKNAKIYLYGSTFRNNASDWNNGRGIDDRGVNLDTLYMENNTIYNIASRFLRDGGGYINYFYANHNTFANTGLRLLDIGECPKVVFKNNIAYNCGFLGKGKSATDALLSLNPLTNTVFAGVTQSVEVHHNNFYLSPEISSTYRDTVIAVPNYNAQMTAAIAASGTGGNTISEKLTFTLVPPLDNSIVLVSAYWADPLLGGSPNAIGIRADGTYNYAYPTTVQSYTKATSNQPLGALTWFNLTLGVNNTEIPADYSLMQNYPNPFNPTTNINYSIPVQSSVRIDVYNSLGQLINTIVNENQNPGQHQVQWNGRNISGQSVPSGIYLYKISANNFVQTKKMMLVK